MSNWRINTAQKWSFRKSRLSTLGIPVSRGIRIVVALLLLVGIVSSAFLIADASSAEDKTITDEKTITHFQCDNIASLDYLVHLHPNVLYESSTIGPDQIYFSNLIDYLDVFASYEFSSDKPADVSGHYTATAYLEGANIPAKNFPLKLGIPQSSLSYDHSSQIDYTVSLKPNSLYSTNTLGPGETYFSNIVDSININASYALSTNNRSQSSGQYQIVAILRASSYWEKSYVLVPSTTFDASGTETSLSEKLTIDLAEYQQLAENVNNELGISPRNIDLVIQFEIDLNAKTDDGAAHDTLIPMMTIPISSTMFNIDPALLFQQESGIVESTETGADRVDFNADGTSVTRNEYFKIELAPYHQMMKTILSQTGASIKTPQLRISFDVNTTAKTDHGEIDRSLSPDIIIPLSGTTLEIAGLRSQTMPGSISETETVSYIEEADNSSGSFVAMLVVFSVLFIGFVITTREKSAVDKSITEKEVAAIGKKYKERLVEATYQAPLEGEKTITLNSMEDIDVISEHLGKPIIHQNPDGPGYSHVYFTFDGSTRYEYILREEEVERPEE